MRFARPGGCPPNRANSSVALLDTMRPNGRGQNWESGQRAFLRPTSHRRHTRCTGAWSLLPGALVRLSLRDRGPRSRLSCDGRLSRGTRFFRPPHNSYLDRTSTSENLVIEKVLWITHSITDLDNYPLGPSVCPGVQWDTRPTARVSRLRHGFSRRSRYQPRKARKVGFMADHPKFAGRSS